MICGRGLENLMGLGGRCDYGLGFGCGAGGAGVSIVSYSMGQAVYDFEQGTSERLGLRYCASLHVRMVFIARGPVCEML